MTARPTAAQLDAAREALANRSPSLSKHLYHALAEVDALRAEVAKLRAVAEAARMLDRALEGDGRHDVACAAIIRALAALDDRKETENV